MASETFIGDRPPPHFYRAGVEFDCQCARCGSSATSERCDMCEDGLCGHDCGEDCCCCLNPEANVLCDYCGGTGIFHFCCSSPEWCNANPLPGREDMPRGAIEWYTYKEPSND